MPQTSAPVFDRHLDFEPASTAAAPGLDTFLKQAPAKWAVYLLADADDRPVQLLCVKNLRYSLKRRLGGDEQIGSSRRVNYREIVRRVHWRRVDSALEADWLYYEAARVCFPDTYQGMVGFRPAWFVHVDPDAPFPRYTKTTDLVRAAAAGGHGGTGAGGSLFGPLEDKHAAGKLVQLVEDAFDLCRYHHILVESPRGKACAYKEMGKCPAPCDGTISAEQYRQLVRWSARTLEEPAEFLRDQEARMRAAAAELRFETAAKIKQFVAQLEQLGKGPFRHVRPLHDFVFVSLQHGPRAGTAKVFLVSRGRVEEILGIVGGQPKPGQVLRAALERAAELDAEPLDPAGAERIGIVTHHLFSGKHRGVFLRLETIDEKALAKGFRELGKQAQPEEETEGEGVLKELQSLG
jgi:excinuclease UvrABC nuclease subunit